MDKHMGKLGLLTGIALAAILTLAIVGNWREAEAEEAVSRDLTANNAKVEPKVPKAEKVPPADGFDFPVGPPDAKKYYNAQGFQRNDHLGEDWNGVGGGNTDKGDLVYSVAIGKVTTAEDFGPGWGNVVRILHNIGSESHPRLIESLYAHLDVMEVKPGDLVKRGQEIGKIGDAHGAYWAHLHLEMRWDIEMELGGGYSTDTTGFLVPTKFIQTHRTM
jgi:murein DD-endopeptidase MepM/ murein hydrolase activator NlpD